MCCSRISPTAQCATPTTASSGLARSFAAWAESIETEFGYRAEFRDIGSVDEEHGAPTQMAVFTR